jgi:uncharacterized protein (DUF1778 family)
MYGGNVGTKTERIEARLSPVERELIESASELEAVSVSAFVVGAATRRAEEVLGHQHVTALPAELFDRLVAGLDDPDPAPGLAAAAKRARKQPRIA